MAIQADGKIVVTGNWQTTKGRLDYSDFAVVRYNPNGSLDTTFGPSHTGLVTTSVASLSGYDSEWSRAVVAQPDGKILIAGQVLKNASGDYDFALVRYNSNGTLDSSFGAGGIVTTSFVPGGGFDALWDATLQTIDNGDGSTSLKIVAVGSTADFSVTPSVGWSFSLARYNLDGSLDATFGKGGKVVTQLNTGDGRGSARSVAIQPDGKIVVGGTAYVSALQEDHEFALARYDTAGNLDPTFGTGGLVTATHPGADEGRCLGPPTGRQDRHGGIRGRFRHRLLTRLRRCPIQQRRQLRRQFRDRRLLDQCVLRRRR